MKRMLWISALLIIIAVMAIIVCATMRKNAPTENPEDVICGGTTDKTDHNAPKTIESTQIIEFCCEFSGYGLPFNAPFSGKAYRLEAKEENGVVKVSCSVRTIDGDCEEKEKQFDADGAFMEQLQDIVRQHELVQYNGLDVMVAGIADVYGALMDISYASGESIFARNNARNFLSIDAMTALEALFCSQVSE